MRALHQVVGADEVGCLALLDGPEGQGNGQMSLAHTGRIQQQDVAGLGYEGQIGQFLDHPLVNGGLEGEVELLQGALEGKVGHPGLGGEVAFPAGAHFHTQQIGQYLRVGQLLAGGDGDLRPMRTALSKIRRRLGDDPDNPNYIFTEPRVGYRIARGRDGQPS